jgi:hypothetical protein
LNTCFILLVCSACTVFLVHKVLNDMVEVCDFSRLAIEAFDATSQVLSDSIMVQTALRQHAVQISGDSVQGLVVVLSRIPSLKISR